MSHKIKLSAALPQGEANGLRDHTDAFLDDPAGLRLAVVVLGARGTVEDYEKAEVTAVVRVHRLELITDQTDAAAVKRLMLRAHEQRTGQTVLPLDLESDIDAVFAKFAKPPQAKSEQDGDQ